jgi:hypothetical protein
VLIGDENRMQYCNNKYPILLPNPITQVADMPYPLYLSLQGKYFVGYADEMEFGNGTIAWAGLVNPSSSGVNLHVYVWTVTNIGQLPLQAEIWFNTDPPGNPVRSELVTPANTAICPLPRPKVKLLEASNASGEPEGGIKMFQRSVDPEITIASEENGALIFPPGGSLIITLSYSEATSELGLGRVAFGWSEEEIK